MSAVDYVMDFEGIKTWKLSKKVWGVVGSLI